MSKRMLPILLIAFLAAAACSWVVYKALASRVVPTQMAGTRIITAAVDLKLGSVLRAVDLSSEVVQGAVPKGAFLKPEDLVGRGVISAIYAGEPILDSRLAPVGSGGGLSSTIPKGMRAIAVKVDDVVGVAGFVTPGQRVDVLVSGNPPNEDTQKYGTQVRTLLQNIEVLSAGQDIQKDAEGKPQQVQVVNLLVTPNDAELLTLASGQTRIQLVLRNPLDNELSKPPGSAMTQLFTGLAPPKAVGVAQHKAAPKSDSFVVEVINGNKHSEEKFIASESKQ